MAIDPVTAVGLGAGILQFVDFTSKLLSVSREIQDAATGATLENNDLEAITRSLIQLLDKLMGTEEDSNTPDSERSLMSMSSLCQSVASELLHALEKLKLQGHRIRFSGTVQALKTVWSKAKIDHLRLRLEQCRNGIHTALLVSLTNKIDQITPVVLHKLQTGSFIDQLKKETLEAVRDGNLNIAETNDTAVRREAGSELGSTLARSLSRLTQMERNDFIHSQILEHLRFDDQQERESRIQEAHVKTFRWVWCDPGDHDNTPWSNFVTWMEGGDDHLYWVTGKPGSGKSTLMKYIVHDPRCTELLQQWAGELPLVVTRFYLWNSGSHNQMSQEGLFRSILYDALQQMPTLVSKLFPRRWIRCQSFGCDLRHWDPTELYDAFKNLAICATDFKLCLFVDGLDEFDGDSQQLVNLFHMVISYPNVKTCISSRPWAVFEEAFRHRPSLRLEDITYPDILAFITSHFEHNSGFVALEKQEPEFSSTLIQNIAKKSCGVFLWVDLVVKSLLNGLSNYDRVSDLQRRLDELPNDLEAFYQKIFASIDSFYLERSSQLFQLHDASQGNLTAIGLSFADEGAAKATQMALDYPIKALTGQESQYRYEQVKRRLVSHCKGFLEIPEFKYEETDEVRRHPPHLRKGPPPYLRKVAYLHRTVRDFLNSPPIRKEIAQRMGTFDSNKPLLSSTILMIKTWDSNTGDFNSLAEHGKRAMEYATEAAKSSALEHKLLDEINRSMEHHCKTSPGWYQVHNANLVHWQSACTDSRFSHSPTTFLELASMHELHGYLSSKILQDVPVFSDQKTTPLLHRIVSQWREYPSFQDPKLSDHVIATPNAKLIEHLLETGSDPNYEAGEYTIWETILQECIKVSKHQYEWSANDVETRLIPIMQSWAHTVEVAIKCGADPRMNNNSQQGNCVREAFGNLLPNEAARLEKLNSCTNKRWSKLRKFITPTPRCQGETYVDRIPITIHNRNERVAMKKTRWHRPVSQPPQSPHDQSDSGEPTANAEERRQRKLKQRRCKPYVEWPGNNHKVL